MYTTKLTCGQLDSSHQQRDKVKAELENTMNVEKARKFDTESHVRPGLANAAGWTTRHSVDRQFVCTDFC